MGGATNRKDLVDRLKRSSEVDITVVGRATKKRFSTPVWFVLERDRVLLLPIKGSGSNWLKNLVKDPLIEIGVGDTRRTSKATIITDPERLNAVFDKFRAKYGSMWSESYYTTRDVYVEVPV